jgi:hypothetical protein
VEECKVLLSNISLLDNMEDTWIWEFNLDDMYSVKEVDVLISNFDVVAGSPLYKVIWNSLVLLKILMFTWRLLRNCLPFKDNIYEREMQSFVFLCG